MAKTCFIISTIGKEGSPVRKAADDKYELIYSPVLQELGYDVTRSDKISSPGSISREIVQNLIDADLVLADVTDENSNVFYELAIRNAIKKPVIVFRRPNQSMPFDIYDKRAISISSTDPRVWEEAKLKLKSHVKMAENNPQHASESILSEFTIDIKTDKSRTDLDKIYSLLKDIQDELRNISGLPSERTSQIAVSDFLQQFEHTGYHPVSIPIGTSVPGCEKNKKCFIPYELKIKKGQGVLWTNDDTAAHTITSGIAKEGPDGHFDSSLFMSGTNFSHKFEERGEFPYFCMVHPWQEGIIIVQ
ncbi:MAG: cupredoxin domain-containing protein [Nitrosarchaeum sp.]